MKKLKIFIQNNYKWIILLIMSIVFIWFALRVKEDPSLGIDTAIYNFVHMFESDRLTKFFKFITNLVSVYSITLICLVFVLFAIIKKKKRYAIFVLSNVLLIITLNILLKHIFARTRPEVMLIPEFGYSFPSGHAMVSMAFYGLFIYLFFHSKINNIIKYLGSFLILSLIILVGLSRVYLNVHYVSDVIAGFSISIIYLIIFTKFMKVFTSNDLKKEKLYKSFYHAFVGIATAFKLERNMKIHLIAIIFVLIFGWLLSISLSEWVICLILFALVISLEIINTSIENTVDLITTEYNIKAKIAKDTAAAAVLIASIISAIIGLLIFIPKIFF